MKDRVDKGELDQFLKDRDQLLMAAWTLPNEGKLNDSERFEALKNFSAYCKRRDISFAEVGRQIGSPRETTIYDLCVKHVFREGADDHIRKLNNWVEQHARQQAAQIQGGFVDFRVSLEILGVARMVRENKTMGLLIGPTGIGKSRCAHALLGTYAGSILLTATAESRTPRSFIRLLARELGVMNWNSRATRVLGRQERIVEEMRNTGRLIMIDEAHKLTDECLETVREIHDLTGCPILMFAVKDLRDRILRMASPDAGQMYSRFDIVRDLAAGRDMHCGGKPMYSVEEIIKAYQQAPIKLSKDGAKFLFEIANRLGFGSLRRCRMLITNGARRARKRQNLSDDETVTVTADDLAYASSRLRPEADEAEFTSQSVKRATAAEAIA